MVTIQRDGVEVEVDPEDEGVEIEAELVEAPDVGEIPDPAAEDPARLAAVEELISMGFTEPTARLMAGLPPA